MPAEVILMALQALLEALLPLKRPVVLIGGLALAIWKHPRFTRDVDVLLSLDGLGVEDLMSVLAPAGFRPKTDGTLVPLDGFDVLQLIYESNDNLVGIQVDIFVAEGEYQQLALERSVPNELPDFRMPVRVLSCEDLILHKLLAGRLIDRADVIALLHENQPSLDLDYLKHWASELGLKREFDKSWKEAFPKSPPIG